MAQINSREEFKNYCLRRLGAPVIKINVDDDQVEERIEDALLYFRDYHFDATEKTYLKYQITEEDIANRYIDITRASGSASIASGNTIVIGNGTVFSEDMQNANITIRIANQTRQVVSVESPTALTVNSAFTVTSNNQNIYIPRTADSIIGITRILPLSDGLSTMNMFDFRYQLRLNELYDFTSASFVPYVITMQQLRMIDMLFTGEKEVRFNRHSNRLYIDMTWDYISPGEFIMAEAWRVVSENFTDIWNNRWLKQYATALIKRQWGNNMKKYTGVALVGGVQMNGQVIYQEAEDEIQRLEAEMISKHSRPVEFFMG